jgi:proline iminopeptidase
MPVEHLVTGSCKPLRQALRVAPTFLVATMLLPACGKEAPRPAATPPAATTAASAALGLGEGYGHSWGTVLALEYYKAHPEHVAGIVFGGSVFDWRAYARETEAWTKHLSDSSQQAITAWKQGGSPDAPGFKAATDEFYAQFVWRRPVTADLDSTMAGFGNEQYTYMQGAYEYVVTGTLKNYDARADLPRIQVPVLSTTGEFDEVGPKTVEAHAKLIPGAQFVLYREAGHVTSWDARDANVKDVREFLRTVDQR